MSQQIHIDIVHAKIIQNAYCGIRLHGQNGSHVIFLKIDPKQWICMDRGYCNSFYFYLWLYNY